MKVFVSSNGRISVNDLNKYIKQLYKEYMVMVNIQKLEGLAF